MPKLRLPNDWKQKTRRALRRLNKYAAVCFWCGHGYAEYSKQLEDEHFAHHCPDAPEELKKRALAALDSRRARDDNRKKGKLRRCK